MPGLRTYILIFLIAPIAFYSQKDSLDPLIKKRRQWLVAGGSGFLTVSSLIGLHQAWYKDYNTGRFHFFNDNGEWLQMDKAGHVYTNYQMADLMMEGFEWAGFSRQKKLVYGGGMGFAYLTLVECMDGFSRGWGFSWGDMASNTAGASLALAQEIYWKEQKFRLKLSFSESGLAQYNPRLLGNTPATRLLKDYNAQTYWLSFNPFTLGSKKSKIPSWLQLSLGYGAYGMLGGHHNNVLAVDEAGNALQFERMRRYYLSMDIDLTKIKTRSKYLKGFFRLINMLKFPAPALEFSKNGARFYYIYY